MKIRTTIILLVVLALLGGYLYWSGEAEEEPATDTAETTSSIPVVEVDASAVTAIEVRGAAGEPMRIEQEGGDWNITAPASSPADVLEVTRVITDLAGLTATRIITPTDSDLAPYGLNNPAHEIVLEGEAGTLATLHIGTTNPIGSATYLQRGDSPTIYLVSTFQVSAAQSWLTTPPVPQPTMPPMDAPVPFETPAP